MNSISTLNIGEITGTALASLLHMAFSRRSRLALATAALAASVLTGETVTAGIELARQGSIDLTIHPGYAVPVIDLDNENFGGLALAVGGGYAVADGLLVGVRGRFDYLLLDTPTDLQAWIIDAQATLGWFAWRGLQPYLALGVAIVGDAYAGDVAHDPYFGASVGLSYTFGPRRLDRAAIGLEVGAEIAMMFHPDFQRTTTMAGTLNDGVFAYPLIYVGGRFSFAPGSPDNEVDDAK